ncbi:uncharacterized protein LOC116340642 [Contarinia nasturtii]|uniref:uncharacterized protein LOC116340642 n=1 Tax=Contarinia nasturtii TaxID=265458 RepID=UPI0012D49026|nr:uncharacterized protein LOC116340642 [Contarinia nasturtii]
MTTFRTLLFLIFSIFTSISSNDARDSGHDLNFIAVRMMEEFIRANNYSTDCLQQVKNQISVEFFVDKMFRKKLINKHNELNKKLYNVNEAFAHNLQNTKKDVQLQTFFVSDSTEVYDITINKVNGLFGEFQFSSVQMTEILLQFIGSNQLKHSIHKSIRLVTEPVKIKMDPLSSNRVNFNYYTFDNVWNYEIDFEISNKSIIKFPYNPSALYPSEITLNVLNFIESHPNFITSLNYDNEQQIKLININGTYILKGYPVIEKLSSAQVKAIISDKDDL